MKKSMKKFEVKELTNIEAVKGGDKIGMERDEAERTQIQFEKRS